MVGLETYGPVRADDVCELLVTADLPGVDEKDVVVTVSGDTLTIRAEKKVEHEEKGDDGHYVERRVHLLSRSIRLPFEVKEEEIDADFDDGVLTVCVHKPPKAIGVQKPKPLEVEETVRRIEVREKSRLREPAKVEVKDG
jgi:HSP20 family protein